MLKFLATAASVSQETKIREMISSLDACAAAEAFGTCRQEKNFLVPCHVCN